jgi:hypothetical protein
MFYIKQVRKFKHPFHRIKLHGSLELLSPCPVVNFAVCRIPLVGGDQADTAPELWPDEEQYN